MTFSDPEIAKLLNKDFVCAWMNKTPKTKYADGLYADKKCPQGLSNGRGASNVTAIFAAAEGTVLHAIPGYLDPPSFKRHLSFALSMKRLLKMADVAEMSREQIYKATHLRETKNRETLEERAHLVMASRLMRMEEFPTDLFDLLAYR